MSSLEWIMAGIVAVGAAIGFMKGAIPSVGFHCRAVGRLVIGTGVICNRRRQAGRSIRNFGDGGACIGFCAYRHRSSIVFSGTGFFSDAHCGRNTVRRRQSLFRCVIVGALKCVLLLSIAIHLMEFIDAEDNLIGQTVKRQSLLYYPIRNSTVFFYPAIKNVSNQLRGLTYAVRTQ